MKNAFQLTLPFCCSVQDYHDFDGVLYHLQECLSISADKKVQLQAAAVKPKKILDALSCFEIGCVNGQYVGIIYSPLVLGREWDVKDVEPYHVYLDKLQKDYRDGLSKKKKELDPLFPASQFINIYEMINEDNPEALDAKVVYQSWRSKKEGEEIALATPQVSTTRKRPRL